MPLDITDLLEHAQTEAKAKQNKTKAALRISESIMSRKRIFVILLSLAIACLSCNWPPMMVAVSNDDIDTIQALLDQGEDINKKDQSGWTPLMAAATFSKDASTVRFLIDNGADVNAKDNKGVTALMIASRFGNISAVKTLLEEDVDVNAKDDNGETALTAAEEMHAEIEKELQEKGVDANSGDLSRMEPLAEEQISAYTEIIDLLKQHGAKE